MNVAPASDYKKIQLRRNKNPPACAEGFECSINNKADLWTRAKDTQNAA